MKEEQPDIAPFPPPLSASYCLPRRAEGLAGKILSTIEPHTEADPAAVLVSVLAMFGNAVGCGPHVKIEESVHAPTLYVCVVGATSSGPRKGTSAEIARRLVTDADPTWTGQIKDGLVSGEGVIHHLRNGRAKPRMPNRGRADEVEMIDEGVKDKRLFILSTEFAQVLAVLRRPENTLSPVLRALWDRGSAETLAKNCPERTTGAVVSILAHITPTELHQRLDSTELANGFANRFLFIVSERSQFLPRGGQVPEGSLRRMTTELRQAITCARKLNGMQMTEEAWDHWDSQYRRLASPHLGLLGEVTARGPAHVRRLSMLYALLDQHSEIGLQHLLAGLSLWRYSAQSALCIFGDRVGDRRADKLLALLRKVGTEGATRGQIRDHLGNRVQAIDIDEALALLEENGLAYVTMRASTGGRRAECWSATDRSNPQPVAIDRGQS